MAGTVPAPLDRLSLFVKSGAVIPMLPADVDSLSPYGGKKVVNLKDRRDRMRLLAFPAKGTTKDTMMSSEPLISAGKRGQWTLTIKASRKRLYSIEASTLNLKGAHGGSFRACKVELDGRALLKKKWSQNRAGGVLKLTVKTKRRPSESLLRLTRTVSGRGMYPRPWREDEHGQN